MAGFLLHHISIPTRDLAASARFYETVLELERLPRPDFPFGGLWYACGDRQLHIIENRGGTFRSSAAIGSRDVHFALRTAAFEDMVAALQGHGYSENRPADDPLRIRVVRNSRAGFNQLFLVDPDNHTIEINDASIPECGGEVQGLSRASEPSESGP